MFESAVLVGREALRAFDLDEDEAARVDEHEYRRRDAERPASQSQSGDLHASKE